MKASCQGCGVTLKAPVPDVCPVCGRTPPVVIAPDERSEWQQSIERRKQRLALMVAFGATVLMAGYLAWAVYVGHL